MNVHKRVAKNFLQLHIDAMQFGFMLECTTTDAMFTVCEHQENCHAINKTPYMTFVNMETFDHVPRRVILSVFSQAWRRNIADDASYKSMWENARRKAKWVLVVTRVKISVQKRKR